MYINLETLEYPIYEGDIKLRHPNISFPQNFVPPDGYAKVNPTSRPTCAQLQKIVELPPELVDGVWRQRWAVYDLSDDELVLAKERLKNSIINRVQKQLDVFAKTKGYDSILSLCSYATSNNPSFRSESQHGIAVRDNTWERVFALLDDIELGTKDAMKTYNEIEAHLPTLEWP